MTNLCNSNVFTNFIPICLRESAALEKLPRGTTINKTHFSESIKYCELQINEFNYFFVLVLATIYSEKLCDFYLLRAELHKYLEIIWNSNSKCKFNCCDMFELNAALHSVRFLSSNFEIHEDIDQHDVQKMEIDLQITHDQQSERQYKCIDDSCVKTTAKATYTLVDLYNELVSLINQIDHCYDNNDVTKQHSQCEEFKKEFKKFSPIKSCGLKYWMGGRFVQDKNTEWSNAIFKVSESINKGNIVAYMNLGELYEYACEWKNANDTYKKGINYLRVKTNNSLIMTISEFQLMAKLKNAELKTRNLENYCIVPTNDILESADNYIGDYADNYTDYTNFTDSKSCNFSLLSI